MKILAIDYGKKWIGLAISDENKKWAFPYDILTHDKNLFFRLNEIVKRENIYKIVIGLPINRNMQSTNQTEEVRNWTEKLIQKVELPVDFENEIFTTKMANDIKAKKEHARAAALILESYLAHQLKL